MDYCHTHLEVTNVETMIWKQFYYANNVLNMGDFDAEYIQ